MGAAFVAKPGLDRNFSTITFCMAQLAMDIEPGVGMLAGAAVLHGLSHTILGALFIACLVVFVAPGVCRLLLKRWNKEVIHYKMPSLVLSESVPKIAVIIGAFYGTLSHVALDSLMHHDIQPLLPFSRENPLKGLVSHDGVYQLCAMAGVLGLVVWYARKRGRYQKDVGVVRVEPDTEVKIPSQGAATRWLKELCFTWCWVLLLTVVAFVLYGAAIFSMMALMGAVLLGLPFAVIGQLVAKDPKKGWRRLTVMVSVPIVTLLCVSLVDQEIPENAAPIVKAIESYRFENGHYPDSLKMLTPRHLAEIPRVRFSLVQPQISYRLTGGKPYLAIPSAAGDAFAQHEYDFEMKVWIHHS